MTYTPEMELIDQLCGSDVPLALALRLFPNAAQARAVIAIYVEKDIIATSSGGAVLPKWNALAVLRNADSARLQEDNLVLSVTELGVKAFETGDWEKT